MAEPTTFRRSEDNERLAGATTSPAHNCSWAPVPPGVTAQKRIVEANIALAENTHPSQVLKKVQASPRRRCVFVVGKAALRTRFRKRRGVA